MQFLYLKKTQGKVLKHVNKWKQCATYQYKAPGKKNDKKRSINKKILIVITAKACAKPKT